MDRIRTQAARRACTVLLGALGAAGALGLGPAALGLAPTAQAMGIPRTIDHLTVTYDDGSGEVRTFDVTCDPRSTDATCAYLDSIGGPVPAVPDGQVCSMLYGGPQTARVTGMWHGRPVAETYSRTDGCEVARWSRMEPALPDPRTPMKHGPVRS
jgi:hypothetical protein